MEHPYNEEILEKIERYLAREMPAGERSTFDAEIAADAQLREAVERHRLLIEGLEMSGYMRERERWQMVQEAIATETDIGNQPPDERGEASEKSRKLSPAWLFGLIAFGILLGIAGTRFYQYASRPAPALETPKTPAPIAHDQPDEAEMPLGYDGGKIVRKVPFTVAVALDGRLNTVSTVSRTVNLFKKDQSLVTYRLDAETLTLYLAESAVKTVATMPMEWLAVENETGTARANYLKLGKHLFRLEPLDDERPLGALTDSLMLKQPEK